MVTFSQDLAMQAIGSLARDSKKQSRTALCCLMMVLPTASFLPPACASDALTAAADSLIQRIIALTITQEYDSALATCRHLQSMPDCLPHGHFLKAAVLQSRMLDLENDAGKEEFFAEAQKARWLFQRRLRENPRSAICHFFIGATHGYEAFYNAKRGRLLEGFRSGWLCIKELNAALALDPKLYDAYLGIGTFRYYQAKLGKNFAWLPLIEDKREDAIGMIRKAIHSGAYSKQAAINGLSWILLDEGRALEALALVDSALAEYPASRFFLWGKAAAYARLKNWDEAARTYELILETFAAENHPSPYNELVCYLRLAELRFEQADYAACRERLVALFAMPLGKEEKAKGKKIIKRARELEKQLANYY